MNSYSKLINNTFIFALGTLGSRIISFVLVPIYTFYLTKGEYGVADLLTTSVAMLLPIVTASVADAILRFVINSSYDRSIIMTNSMIVFLIGYIIILFFYPILKYLNIFNDYLHYLYLLVLLQSLNLIFSQYARGIGNSKIFAINGILTTFFSGFFNIVFIVVFKWSLNGYFLSFILAYLCSIIYLVLRTKPLNKVSMGKFNYKIMITILQYSVPLIPNSLMWWLINSSSRFFINTYVGLDANGLFAVSSKVPTIINIVSQVFSQAWQLSAFEEYEKNNNGIFFSKVLNAYLSILLIVSSLIFIVLKPLFVILFDLSYFDAWKPVPFLILGSVFSACSGFIGVSYTASEQTKGVFKTSLYGGILSFILNFLFIPSLGIIGAGISSMFSFFLMFIIRYFDTKNLIKLNIQWKKFSFTILLLFAQISTLFAIDNLITLLFLNTISFLLILLANKDVLILGTKLLHVFLKK